MPLSVAFGQNLDEQQIRSRAYFRIAREQNLTPSARGNQVDDERARKGARNINFEFKIRILNFKLLLNIIE